MNCENCGGEGYIEYANGWDDFDRVPCDNCYEPLEVKHEPE